MSFRDLPTSGHHRSESKVRQMARRQKDIRDIIEQTIQLRNKSLLTMFCRRALTAIHSLKI